MSEQVMEMMSLLRQCAFEKVVEMERFDATGRARKASD